MPRGGNGPDPVRSRPSRALRQSRRCTGSAWTRRAPADHQRQNRSMVANSRRQSRHWSRCSMACANGRGAKISGAGGRSAGSTARDIPREAKRVPPQDGQETSPSICSAMAASVPAQPLSHTRAPPRNCSTPGPCLHAAVGGESRSAAWLGTRLTNGGHQHTRAPRTAHNAPGTSSSPPGMPDSALPACC
jgi:hypothetical protein